MLVFLIMDILRVKIIVTVDDKDKHITIGNDKMVLNKPVVILL